MKLFKTILLTIASIGLFIPMASAQPSSSISLNPSPAPALGATVTFVTTFPNGTKNPVVEVNCYQNGAIVWGEVDTVSSAANPGVKLGGDSSPWLQNGGPASCTAKLQSRVFTHSGEVVNTLAETSFLAGSTQAAAAANSCSVSPSPATSGSTVQFSQSGLKANTNYGVVWNWPDGSSTGTGTRTDSTGTLAVVENVYAASGTSVTVFSQNLKNGSPICSVTFAVN